MESVVSFGDWVRRRRKALDLTQQQLAQRVGCSLAALQKIERDERRPSRQLAALLAERLQLPPDQREPFVKVARGERLVETLAPIPHPNLAAPAGRPARPGLPAPATALVGREAEVAEIVRLLRDPACRLLTLAGPGGIGKTRLALEAARQIQAAFAHGAAFVALAGVAQPDFIVPGLADALGFAFFGANPPKTQLLDFVREKELLLVLDNLEHLLGGIDLLAELLERAPGLKLLTTSREALNLLSEWVFAVQGLPIPSTAALDQLEANSAAALFIQRARQARHNFAPAQDDRAAIQRICQLVDGLPLGLELAAAWVRLMPPDHIASEIERSLDFLTTAARDVPPRHRSLRAVFDYSWSLLSAEERRALRRLSVFGGSFTRAAAEQVAGAALSVLSALVDKSLVRRAAPPEVRYDLHELVRQYLSAKLSADQQEHELTRDLHARYFAALVEGWVPGLRGAQQPAVVAAMRSEFDNLWLAWEWMIARGQVAAIQQALLGLWAFLDLQSLFQAGVTLLGQAEAMLRAQPPAGARIALAQVLTRQAYFHLRLGAQAQAQAQLQESLALLRPGDAPSALADTLLFLGNTALLLGQYAEARQFAQESVDLNQTLGRDWERAYGLALLGYLAMWQGQLAEAQPLLSAGVGLFRAVGDPRQTAYALLAHGAILNLLGERDQARQRLAESLELSRALDDKWGLGNTLRNLGLMTLAGGEAAPAHALFRESVALFEEMGDRWSLSQGLLSLGAAAAALGEHAESRQVLLRALRTAVNINALPFALEALLGLAEWLFTQNGESERAYAVVACVLAHPAASQETKDRAEKLRAQVAPALTPAQPESDPAAPFEYLVAEMLELDTETARR